MQRKKLQERKAALAGVRRVREGLEQVQREAAQRKAKTAQMEEQRTTQTKQIEEQKKARSWKQILMGDAARRGGTGETKNVGA